jgi:NADH:ubiquinone oxidoreductase subunit 4 (subunit M)
MNGKVGAMLEILERVGFPVAVSIALFLLYLGVLPSPVVERLDAMHQPIIKSLEEFRQNEVDKTVILRNICVNTALLVKRDWKECFPR